MVTSRQSRRYLCFKLLDIYISLSPGFRFYLVTPLFSLSVTVNAWSLVKDVIETSISFGLLMLFWTMEGDYLYHWRWEKIFASHSAWEILAKEPK